MSEVEPFQIDERIQRQVWRGLGTKPLKQIAEEAGLDRDQIIRIREELLSSVDDLTVEQAQMKLLVDLEHMAQEARERAQNTDDEYYSGMVNSAVSAIKAIQAERQRIKKEDRSRIERLNDLRVRELTRLVDESTFRFINGLSEEHGLDPEELTVQFREHLKKAAEQMERS